MGILKTLFIFICWISVQAQGLDRQIDAFRKSYQLEAAGEYNKAIQALREVYDEQSYETNLRLGWLCYQAGLLTESISYYNKAISLRKTSIEARMGLVLPLSTMGSWDAVLKTYLEILEFNPAHDVVLYRTGLIYYNRQDYKTAYNYFEKLLNFYPFSYDALVMSGWTNFQLGKYTEARHLFQKALLYYPDDPVITDALKKIK